MSRQFEVRTLHQSDYGNWDRVVGESLGGSPYAMSGYLAALCQVTGSQHRLVAVFDEERIVGGVGLYIRKKRTQLFVRGRYLLYYNGPFVRRIDGASPATQEEHNLKVLAALERELRRSDYDPIEIKPRSTLADCRPFLEAGWRARPCYSYEVDIRDSDRCLASMHRNVRRQIRQAERADVNVYRSDAIEKFWTMHEHTCRRKSFPTYLSRSGMIDWFSTLSRKNLIRLYLAGNSNRDPYAGVLVLACNHPVTHTVCAASHDGNLPPGTNAWLRWNVFLDLSNEGYTGNDLTDAHEPSVARFKRQLGARLVLSHQLNRPATVRDHTHAALHGTTAALKAAVKRILIRGAGS